VADQESTWQNSEREMSFLRGIRACVAMLDTMDLDECSIAGINVPLTRRGRPQDNAVLRTLKEILRRAEPEELEGFCAALTDMAATADEQGDFGRMFTVLIERRAT
jgi:hypothetical protein